MFWVILWAVWVLIFFIICKRLKFEKLKFVVRLLEKGCLLGSFVIAIIQHGKYVFSYVLGNEMMKYYFFVTYFKDAPNYLFIDLCMNLIIDISLILLITFIFYCVLDICFISPYRIRYICMKNLTKEERKAAILRQFIPIQNREYTSKLEDMDFRANEVLIKVDNNAEVCHQKVKTKRR